MPPHRIAQGIDRASSTGLSKQNTQPSVGPFQGTRIKISSSHWVFPFFSTIASATCVCQRLKDQPRSLLVDGPRVSEKFFQGWSVSHTLDLERRNDSDNSCGTRNGMQGRKSKTETRMLSFQRQYDESSHRGKQRQESFWHSFPAFSTFCVG